MSELSGKSRVAGVAGWPVAHSLSPRLHGYWLRQHGIDGAYIPLPIRPDGAADAFKALPLLGLAGANVTVPLKEIAFDAAHARSETATRMGAVNTLVCRPDGTLFGDNTDAYGFMANLKAGARSWRAAAGPVLVLGAGGSARAVLTALLDAGVPELRLANRTEERSVALQRAFGDRIKTIPWDQRSFACEECGLLVNTTSLGMTGNPPLEMALDALPESAVVTDLVYAPLETPLLAAARARGLTAVDGLGMLLHQAVPAFEAFFGVRPEVSDDLRRHVLAGRGG